ncbi:MAG: ribonuclease HII [Tissierellia bacterium]|nr:ribonuclease HII [Tissierellia bacterium]
MKSQDNMINDNKRFDIENYYSSEDLVVFVDEVGRGCVFGDVVACAVAIPKGYFTDNVKDSKKLSDKNRREVSKKLIDDGIIYSIGRISPKIIDEVNILNATFMAMNNAIEDLLIKLDDISPEIVVDGLKANIKFEHHNLVHGDDSSFGVGCASILAKVYRDDLCADWDLDYPIYGIAKHKGYGTPAHKRAVIENGPSPLHRRTFIKKWVTYD